MLNQHDLPCSISRKGNCRNNAPAGCFFISLKREQLTGDGYPIREPGMNKARAGIAFINPDHFHTPPGDLILAEFEQMTDQTPGWTCGNL